MPPMPEHAGAVPASTTLTGWPLRAILIATSVTLVLVSGGLTALALSYLRGQAISAGERLTASFAQVIEEQTSRTLQTVDQQLQIAANQLERLEAEGGLNEQSARALLRTQLQGLPFLRAMWVLDAEGRIAYDSDVGNSGVDLSQRAYVQLYRSAPQTEFSIGAPVASRIEGSWMIPAVRPIRRGDGSIRRLVVAEVDPPYFDTLWHGLDMGAGSSVALFRKDGTLMMRSPFDATKMGLAFPEAPMFGLWRQGANAGSLQEPSRVDGQARLYAYRVLTVQPELSVVAGQSLELVLAPWSRLARVTLVVWALACVAVLVMAGFLDRAWRAGRRAEQRASETAQRLALATDAAQIGVWDWDTRHADQWYATPTYFTMMGYEPTATLGERDAWIKRLHPDDRKGVLERITAVLEGQDLPYHYETRMQHADGSYRWVSVTGQVLSRDDHGKPNRMMGVRIDITERKRAEDALRESEARYRELFYSNPQPMWVFDIETLGFLAVNSAAIAHYGYTQAEFLGMTIRDIRPTDEQQRMMAQAVKQLDGLRNAGLWTHLRKDGSRILVEISSHSLNFGGRAARLVLSHDVTDLNRSRQELEALNQQLEARVEARGKELLQAMAQLVQAEKLAALGSLVSGVAHELSTPVGNLLMVGSTLTEDVQRYGERLLAGNTRRSEVSHWTARLREASLIVEREAARAAKLIADFKLVAARPDSESRQEFALTVLVERVRQKLARPDERKLDRVRVDVPAEIHLNSFPDALEQVLLNLIENALLHAFTTGRQGSILVSASHDGPLVLLRVEDDGCGMADDVLSRVFEPFYTTRLGQGGSGLGLYIVYHLVTAVLGGSIKVDSAPGRGTHVAIRLPVAGGGPQSVGG